MILNESFFRLRNLQMKVAVAPVNRSRPVETHEKYENRRNRDLTRCSGEKVSPGKYVAIQSVICSIVISSAGVLGAGRVYSRTGILPSAIPPAHTNTHSPNPSARTADWKNAEQH